MRAKFLAAAAIFGLLAATLVISSRPSDEQVVPQPTASIGYVVYELTDSELAGALTGGAAAGAGGYAGAEWGAKLGFFGGGFVGGLAGAAIGGLVGAA